MANDKKFIVKNGLLTPENAVIGSTTDTGEKLQVTGTTKLTGETQVTQSTAATASLKVTNSGGASASTIVAKFEGDSDSLEIRNISTGDYKITNPQQDNSINFYDGIAGITINYAGTEKLAFTDTGTDFTGLSTTTIEGNRILTTADEGSGNNLDADTVDGLEAAQFLRSDIADSAAGKITFQSDIDVDGNAQFDGTLTVDQGALFKALLTAQANLQVDGSAVIDGNLTVSGNTTYVNTEEILLSDNIITLNANYTGSTPSENAGIEVERGTLANSKLVWNETADYWQLEVNNSVIGRIITTADEGSGNGFDADTVDGLEAAQFLRADADDTATGNITIEGDLTIGDNAGPARIFFDGNGINRTLYSAAGDIGFLNSSANWAMKSDADGDLEVERDVEAGRDVTAANDVVAAQDITATSGNISATAGDVTAGDDVIAQNNITATSGNIAATAGNVTAGQDVTAGDDMIAQNNITATSGNITASSGNISATAGDVTAGDDVIAQNNITATSGNISATAGSVSAGTTVTAGTDVIGQRFVDADNNGYVADPSGTSTMHEIGIDDDLFHNGDTDTKLNFTTDQIKLNTGGTTRLDINNSRVLSNLDTYAPNLYINDAIVHNNDVDTKIVFTTDDISLQTGGAERLGVDNAGVDITGNLDVSGNITAVDGTFTGNLSASRFVDADNNAFYADPASTSVMNRIGINDYIQHNGDTNTFFGFDSDDNIIFTTSATERLEINGTNITGTVDAIFPNVYAARFYDAGNATYYADPASTSRLNTISLVGTIYHDGDTNTYLNFNGADSFEVVTGGSQRLLVNNTYVLANNQMRAPIYYDSNNTNYYGHFDATSVMNSINIDSYIRHNGDTDTYIGYPGNDSFRVVTGSSSRLDINNTNSTFHQPVIVEGDISADRFVDRQSSSYFLNPADASLSATLGGAVRVGTITNNSRWSDSSGTGGISLVTDGDEGGNSTTVAISGAYAGTYALMYLNRIDPSANPTNSGNRYIEFRADGASGGSTIRGDSSGNMYNVLATGTNWGFWTSGYSEALIVDDSGNVMVANGTAPTYTSGDNTPLVGGALTTNKLHVSGSIQLAGNDDAIVIGRGTATFLKDEELGFGWGGGWYMTDGTYLRSRSNKTIYTAGDIWASRYYAHSSTSYYLDPDGDSQLNTVDIDDYVRHRGDTNTYMGFNAADQIQFVTNASNRLQITNSTVRARNKFEVYGSGIELQKQSNGGGVGITMTDQSGELPGLSGKQQASIKVWHADNSVTTGAQLAMVFDSSETAVHYVFGQLNGTQGASIIPRINAQGNLGISTYRWGNAYITSGDFVNLTVTNEIQAPGISGYANYLKSRDNRIIAPSEDTSGRLRFGFTSWNNNNTAPYADYLHLRSYTDSSGGSDNLLMFKKSGLGMRLWQQTWNSGTAYSNFVDFPLYNVNPGTGNDFYADRFIDTNNTAYFADPAGESRLNTIKLDGNAVILREPTGTYGSLAVDGGGRSGWEGFSIGGRSVFMHDNANRTGIYNDVDNHWFMYADRQAAIRLLYNNVEQARTENGYFFANNQLRTPIFYDSQNTGYYVDPNNTTRLNAIQALRYYMNHGTTYYMDEASGNYGSVEVGGYRSGWAGYSIAGQWVFMSDGPSNAGIYNDTDNEWSILARRNAEVELYYNGVEQASTQNGYFFAQNQMRAPIYYDSNNTAYYSNQGSGNTGTAFRTNGIYDRVGFTTSGNGNANILMRAQDYTHWIWQTATNWGIMWAGNTNPAYSHFSTSNPNELVFVGAGNVRASIDLDNGNAYFQGSVSAGNFELNGGNENISLNPAYGSGGADLVLFDMTPYMEARVIQNIDDNENNLTGSTGEYIKGDGPFAGGYVLRSSAYRNFYSNYIPVSPGEEIYGEISTRLISGSGGLLYYGVERFDKDKKPIAGNTGTTYFVVGGSNRTSTNWETLRNHTTMPTSHTPYNGSDGGGVHYVRIRILLNYNAGGALREYGGIMLKRRNAESNLLVDDLLVSDQLTVNGNATIVGDLTVDDITADRIDANIYYDRGNTAYYNDPASNSNTVKQTMQELVVDAGSRNNSNDATAYFSATNNNDWGVIINKNRSSATEYGMDVRMGSSHTYGIRLLAGGAERYRLNNTYMWHRGQSRAPIFYDSDNTGYYGNFAGESRFNTFTTAGRVVIGGTFSNNAYNSIASTRLHFGGGNSDANGNYYIGTNLENYGGNYTKLDLRWHTGIRIGAQPSYGGTRIFNNEDLSTLLFSVGKGDTNTRVESSNLYVMAGDARARLFYDIQDTTYYLDPANNGRVLQLGIGYRSAGKRLDVTGDHGNTAIRLELPTANNGGGTGSIPLQMWVSEPGRTWDGAGFGYNVDNNLNGGTNQYYLGRPNTSHGQAYMRFEKNGYMYFYNTNTAGTRYETLQTRSDNTVYVPNYLFAGNSLRAPIFYDTNNTSYYGDFASTSIMNVVKAQRFAHVDDVSQNDQFGLYFSTGQSTAYAIYREGGAWTYPYPDLRIAFHTGIKFGANASYQGMRFYTDYNMATQVMSVNNGSDPLGSGNVFVNNNLQAGSSLRAPVFYDSNDTGYYGDFNSTSGSAVRQRGGTLYGPNASWGEYLSVGGNGRWTTSYATVSSTNGNLHLDAKNGNNIYLAWYNTSDVLVGGAMQATRYYDRNSLSYYGDFASVSYMNDVRVNILYDRNNTAYYVHNSSGDASLRTVTADTLNMRDRGDFITFYGDDSTYHSISSRDNGGGVTDDLRFNSYHDIFFNLDSNNNNGTGSTGFYVGHHGAATGSISGWPFQAMMDGNTYASNSFRANIFYDRQNTGYYLDPASTSNLNALTLAGTLTSNAIFYVDNPQKYDSTSLSGLTNAPISTRNRDYNVGTSNVYLPLTHQTALYNSGYRTHLNTGLYKYASGWGSGNTGWYAAIGGNDSFPTQAWRLTYDSYIQNSRNLVQTSGSFRAPIFYDLNNTGYYLNPASTSYWNTSQQSGYHTFLNYGIGVTGTYTSTRLQLVFAMGAAYRLPSNGNSTANMYGIAWSHPNAGSKGGANQLNDHGMLIINNGGFRAAISSRAVFASDVRSPIFYDWNNTGYYVDPAATSQLSAVYANNWFRPQGSTGLYFQDYGYGIRSAGGEGNPYGNVSTYNTGRNGWSGYGIGTRWTLMSTESNNWGMHDNTRSWNFYYNGSYHRFYYGYVYSSESFRAPIFYDLDNTGYYGNFAGDTNWNGLTARGQAMIGLQGHTRDGAISNYGRRPNITGDTNYWTGAKGWGRVDFNTVANWGSGFLDTWSNPGNQPSGTSHWVGVQAYHYSNGSARYGWQMVGGPITNLRFRSSWSGFRAWRTIPMLDENSGNGGSMYAGRYYDSNNTAYYGDFASTSVINTIDNRGEIYNDGWFRNDSGGRGLYSTPYGRHFYAAGTSYWHLDGGSSSGGLIIYDRYNGSQGSSTGRRGYLYYDGSGFGLLNSSGGWGVRINPGSSYTEIYRITYMDDARANILYDRNNTAYYFNGASVNSTRFEGVSNRTKAHMMLSGQTRSSAEYYGARPRITSNTDYWTGAIGWGRIDMNTVANWGSGFIDSWSNPGNQPSGTSHWVGVQSYHYTNGGSRYGWQMVGGPITNLRFRSTWGGFRSWRTIPVLDENSTNGGSMYAGRYYDSNNTAFYSDNASTSIFNVTETSRVSFRHAGGNSGQSIGNAYSIFQTSGGWSNPYPALRINYHVGIDFGANPSYQGMRFMNDYNSNTVRFQINGGSSYTYANTWLQVGGGGVGIYDGYNGAHFFPNNQTSYGSWAIYGNRSGWYGLSWPQPTWDPHLMFDGNGSGGIYLQGGGRWVYYHNRSNNCTGFASSSTVSGYRVRINGSLYCNGNVVAYSDERDKENIITIDGALDKVLQLRGVYYNRKTREHLVDDRDEIYKGRQLGLIAQEVKEIVPEVVSWAEEVDQYGLDYPKMVGLLVEGIKDQHAIVEQQKETINNQQKDIDMLKELVYNIQKQLENK